MAYNPSKNYREHIMNKILILILVGLFSVSAFAQANKACPAMKRAEVEILNLAYYDGELSQDRVFCYFLSRAIVAKDGGGLDGELMKSLEFCAQGIRVDFRTMAKEVSLALKTVKGCYSEIGQ